MVSTYYSNRSFKLCGDAVENKKLNAEGVEKLRKLKRKKKLKYTKY